jgi:hypothetical protein
VYLYTENSYYRAQQIRTIARINSYYRAQTVDSKNLGQAKIGL